MSNELYAEKLITLETKIEIQTASGVGDFKKASRLVEVLQLSVRGLPTADGYLLEVCQVFINQNDRQLTEIATSIMQALG